MYNYASLVAEQHALLIYKKLFSLSDLERTDQKRAAKVLNAFSSLEARDKLLARKKLYDTEDEALLFCYAELYIGERITGEVWSQGKVRYRLGLKSVTVPSDGSDSGLLTINKMLLEGYGFKENIGEHFTIKTPTGIVRATTGSSCTCGTKDCLHKVAVKEITQNRKHCKGLYSVNY